jgi:flagellar protein FlgJ
MTSSIGNTNNHAQNFFDLNGLNDIRLQSKSGDQDSKDAALQKAAKQFESIFMQMLLKSMRSAQDVLESDSPFNSESTKFYRDMHDKQLSVELSENGSLGLSELIVRQLGGDSGNFTPNSVLRSDGNLSNNNTLISQPSTTNDSIKSQNSVNSLDTSLSTSNTRHNKQPFSEVIDLVQDKQRFEDPSDFVNALINPAKEVEKKLGIPHQVVIAQAALETGWGKKIITDKSGESTNNLFNIKADKRWAGEQVNKETLEFENGTMVKKNEPFRAYSSIDESVKDYTNFLSNSERYQEALEQPSNVEHFLHNLQKAGYATDPQYANKIVGTLSRVTSLLK